MFGAQGLWAESWTIQVDGETSYSNERIEASQNGGESDTYDIKVPNGAKATVQLRIKTISSSNIGSKTVYVRWNSDFEETLSGEGSIVSRTFSSDGTVTVGVRCSAGTHEVPHERATTIGGKTIYSIYYTTEYWSVYSCAVTYDIEADYESLQPDLTVADLLLSATEAPVDESITLSFSVKNGGGKAANETSVARVYVDGTQVGGDLTVGALAGGASETKALTLPRQVVGEHAVRVVADATNRIAESNEANNERSEAFFVYARTPYTVRFDANGGTGTMEDQSFVCGTAQNLRENKFISNSGKTFAGWALTKNGEAVYSNAEKVNNLSYTSGSVVTLYAVWKSPTWTVSGKTLVGYNLDGCKDIALPSNITAIKANLFTWDDNLRSVTIPNSVTNIGECAFRGCSGLLSIKVATDNPVYKSVNGLLLSKNGATLVHGVNGDVIIPEEVKNIGFGAFISLDELTSVIIPNGVTNIDANAFSFCYGLTSVTIPSSVISIGAEAFGVCNNLKSAKIENGVKYVNDYAFRASGLISITIPDSVTGVGRYAFYGCSGLKSVKLGNGLLGLGEYSFCNCDSLTSVIIPDHVTRLAKCAFSGCSSLTSVTIPDGVTWLDDFVFNDCSSLTSVTIPDSVARIGRLVFEGCSGLARIIFKGDVPSVVDKDAFAWVPSGCMVYVRSDSAGWGNGETWNGLRISRYSKLSKITFDANGGMGGTLFELPPLIDLDAPTVMREGYTFTGWSPDMPSLVPSSNVVYKAQWTPCSYRVQFDANGGSVSPSYKYVSYGMAYGDLPSPMWTGPGDMYIFGGWYTAESGGARITAESTVAITAMQTLYAHWLSLNEYVVTFAANGGGGKMPEQKVEVGKVAKLNPCAFAAPAGKRFAGWRGDNGRRYDDGMLVFNLAKPGEIVTLTAIWE